MTDVVIKYNKHRTIVPQGEQFRLEILPKFYVHADFHNDGEPAHIHVTDLDRMVDDHSRLGEGKDRRISGFHFFHKER